MHIAVIGAGAAGSMAAIFAARGGADVTLIERTADGGRKILISGGGRCNILPSKLDERRFVTDSSPHTLRNIVRSWPLHEQVAFFEKELGIPLVEEAESLKLFPVSNKARDVRDGLLAEARRCGATLRMGAVVGNIAPRGDKWRVLFDEGEPLDVDAVIVATGGLSVPNTGSDGRGLAMLARLGHEMHPTYAALTPLTSDSVRFGTLAGVSLTVTMTARAGRREAVATGGFLFTHKGYSGPAVLDVSHVAVRSHDEETDPAVVTVRWTALSEEAWAEKLGAGGARSVLTVVRDELPDRLAEALILHAYVEPRRTLAQLKREERQRLARTLGRGELPWIGHEGYKKAEVTGGGVSLAEIDPRTMQSRRHPGLYICGEALDAFGPIGGYNFLWAWVTGRAAGTAAAARTS